MGPSRRVMCEYSPGDSNIKGVISLYLLTINCIQMNIQDYKDAVLLDEIAMGTHVDTPVADMIFRYIYYSSWNGTLYLVDPDNGNILGIRALLDIEFNMQ